MRIAIYARYSSDHQDERSIEDQIRLCRERACAIGGNVVGTYTDYAISGAHLKSRPDASRLLRDAQDDCFDAILTEALDRLSRDQEDVAGLYKRLRFASVKIITLSSHPQIAAARVAYGLLPAGHRDRNALDMALGFLPQPKGPTFIGKAIFGSGKSTMDQQRGDPADDVVRHVLVDVVGELDEAEGLAGASSHAPRQVRGVDRQAVTAHARSRLETHEPVRLGGGRLDHLPDVDPHTIGQHRKLVHQCDVDRAEDVLQELRQLGRLGAGHAHDLLAHHLVQRLGTIGADLGQAAEHLWCVAHREVRPARIDALG